VSKTLTLLGFLEKSKCSASLFDGFHENGAQNWDSIMVFGYLFHWFPWFPRKWSPELSQYNGIWMVFWARTRSRTTQKTYIFLYVSWYLTRWDFMKSTKKRSLAFVLFWWFSSPGPKNHPNTIILTQFWAPFARKSWKSMKKVSKYHYTVSILGSIFMKTIKKWGAALGLFQEP
jgi:hypothetical protein